MHRFGFLSAVALASALIMAAPTYVTSQTTTDKIEQKAKSAAQDVKTEAADSWLTAKTKIALYADERVKGGQVSVETVRGTVILRGKVDSDEARTAADSIAKNLEHVKAVKNDLQVVPVATARRPTSPTRTSRARSKPASRRPPSSPRSTSGPMAGSSPSRV